MFFGYPYLATAYRTSVGLIQTMPRIRILLADDHAMFRQAVRTMLEAEGNFAVVGEAGDGERLVALAARTPADVLLLDIDMPALSGLAALRELRRVGIGIRTIILSGHISPAETEEALRLGARGIVGKTASVELLAKSIRHVMSGKYWVSREQTTELLESVNGSPKRAPNRPADVLTRREREMVAAVLRAESNKEIGQRFGIGEQTVKNHLSRIFTKLGVANRLELALFAVTNRLVSEPPPPEADEV